MLLKICEDNFIFNVVHTKYFNVLCYFVIFFLIVLCILVQNDKFLNKVKKSNFKKILIISASGLFVGFLIFLLTLFLNTDSFEGCMTKYNANIYFKMVNSLNHETKKLENSKVIIVGDSRMEYIENDSEIVKPFNFEFIALSGSKEKWFENTALKKLKKMLDKNEYKYYVVINMGVNDLDDKTYKGNDIAEVYFNLYSNLAKKYADVNFYIMSVNPINEKKINKIWTNNNRTNKEIKLFNKTIQKRLKESNLDNMHYFDSYDTLDFQTDDGLHYTQDTNREIINYIANEIFISSV